MASPWRASWREAMEKAEAILAQADGMDADPASVAIVPCESYGPETVRRAVRRVLSELGGDHRLARRGERVLLKPNLLRVASPERAVCTHPRVLEAVLEVVADAGARACVGDSPAYGSLRHVAEGTGIAEVARRFGAELVPLTEPCVVTEGGRVFRTLTVARVAREVDAVVNLPKLKTHRQLYFTGAVKNLFGCVPGRRKAWWHVKAGAYETYFARMLVDTCYALAPRLSILDAVLGMEGDGPGKGSARHVGLILASADASAVDRVAVEVVGLDARRVPTLVAARELGMGQTELGALALRGAALGDVKLAHPFRGPTMVHISFSLPRMVRGTLREAWASAVEPPVATV